MHVTDVRESGIELLDADVENLHEDAEAVLFRVDEAMDLVLDESAGHEITTSAQHFVAASLDSTYETPLGEQDMDESAVFISNEDGEIGYGLVKVEDGGEIEDAIVEFEETYL